MARVAGVDIPDNKRVEIALRRIHGIGPTPQHASRRRRVSPATRRSVRCRTTRWPASGRSSTTEYTVEGDLKREVSDNIRRLQDIALTGGSGTAADCRCTASERRRMHARSGVAAGRSPASGA